MIWQWPGRRLECIQKRTVGLRMTDETTTMTLYPRILLKACGVGRTRPLKCVMSELAQYRMLYQDNAGQMEGIKFIASEE